MGITNVKIYKDEDVLNGLILVERADETLDAYFCKGSKNIRWECEIPDDTMIDKILRDNHIYVPYTIMSERDFDNLRA